MALRRLSPATVLVSAFGALILVGTLALIGKETDLMQLNDGSA